MVIAVLLSSLVGFNQMVALLSALYLVSTFYCREGGVMVNPWRMIAVGIEFMFEPLFSPQRLQRVIQ